MPDFPPPPAFIVFPQGLKLPGSRYVLPGWEFSNTMDSVVAANRIYYIPIFVAVKTKFDRICIYVAAAVSGTAKLGIYSWKNGMPDKLLLNAGTISHGTTGAKELIIDIELQGYYFLAVRCTGAPTLRGANIGFGYTSAVYGLGTAVADFTRVILSIVADFTDPATAPDVAQDASYSFVRLREAS